MTSIVYYPGYSQVTVIENLRVHTILSITQAYPMVVTTVENHGYVPGMRVRFLIPPAFGMVQLNEIEAQVTEVTDDTLTINVDSSSFTPFAYPNPLPGAYTNPSVIPNSSGAYLPPTPLPFGNQNSFDGTIYNAGLP